jgi:hypothetical protein
MYKNCTKCKENKNSSEFYKRKSSKDGLSFSCKKCQLEQKKIYHSINKDKENEKSRLYYELNKEEELKKRKKYYQENKENIIIVKKKYAENNKDKTREMKIKYYKEKRKNDTFWKLKENIRVLIYCSLYHRNFSKKSKTIEILGCSYEEFKIYMENKFEPWMTWENKGLYNGELNYGWDIDHIIPISSAETEEDIIKLNHYTNLQPLCSYFNRYIKTNKSI